MTASVNPVEWFGREPTGGTLNVNASPAAPMEPERREFDAFRECWRRGLLTVLDVDGAKLTVVNPDSLAAVFAEVDRLTSELADAAAEIEAAYKARDAALTEVLGLRRRSASLLAERDRARSALEHRTAERHATVDVLFAERDTARQQRDEATAAQVRADNERKAAERERDDYQRAAWDLSNDLSALERRVLAVADSIEDADAGRLLVDLERKALTAVPGRIRAAVRGAAPGPADGHERPEIVVLCGSTRFKDAWYEQGKRLTYDGKIVLSVGDLDTSSAARTTNVPITPELKAALDELHKRKIDLADRVLVLNVDGYVGESTRSEIDYATARGKPIDYLCPPASPDAVTTEGVRTDGRR